jgi:threonylcarbamoyladenosine tRNA methylthiotransferase MtaB
MKIFLDSVGCRLNQAEIEMFACQFRSVGHEIVADLDEADLVVVNTCTVTQAAASDSRGKIRKAARLGVDKIAVTGCWSSMNPLEAASLPTVKYVVANQDKDSLVSKVLSITGDDISRNRIERQPIPGTRQRTRVFIKVQDGCDNHCTFCVTRIARGPGISRPFDKIMSDIFTARSAQEIVLSGVNLGSWGKDLGKDDNLYGLIQNILEKTDVPRVRLSSLEPWDIDEEFFQLWENPRLCRHLHLPLQSGSARTLKRMARKISPEAFLSLVESAWSKIPGVAITTDIITGFPDESELDFEESLDFVRRLSLAGGHVFTFSPRPATAAARMSNQLPSAIRKERNVRMRAVLSEAAYSYQEKFLGEVMPVLWESVNKIRPDKWVLSGLTSNYLRVRAYSHHPLWNRITPVKLTDLSKEGLWGQVQPG